MYRHLHNSQTKTARWSTGLLWVFLFCLSAPLFGQNLSVTLSTQEPTCNGYTNGVVTANPAGGSGNYTYQWNTGANGQQVVGGAGTYAVTVTDGSGSGTTAMTSVVLGEPSAVTASITSTSSVCTNPGDITVNAGGGTGGYTYSWSNGSTAMSQTGLAPGNYFVTVTDNSGCQTTASTSVFGVLDVSLNVINVTCFNGCDASIEAILTGGTAPYSFMWSNGVTNQVNPDLLPGTYSVTVTDGNGCQAVETATVSNGITINVGVNTTDASCGDGADGSATFNATGGSAPYTYTISGGADANNLMPGTYTVTATDANGCIGTATFTIGGGSNLTVSVTNSFECGDASGSATASVAGGSGNYSYAWSTGDNTAMITGLAPNATYTVTVTDNDSGCTGTGSTFVMGVANVNVTIASMMPSCNGFLDGSATATASGGQEPYTYSWSTGAMTRTIDNLAAGTYSVTVADVNGCGGSAMVTINEPAVLDVNFASTNATCDAPMSGSATAQPSGGTGPYTYAWTTGASSATISNLGAGTYGVTVTDVNGCTVNDMIAITAPASDLSVNVMGTNVSCNGVADGSATAQPMNGSGNYTYAWSNGATTATVTGLAAGTYSVVVSDGNCTATGSITITEPSAVTVSVAATDAGCTSGGSAMAMASGGTGAYTYAWSNGASTATINGVAAGTYTVTVTDANGCTATGSATVSSNATNVDVTVTGTNVTCNGGTDGSATAQVSGTGNYTYAWSNGATTAALSGLAAGTYTVTVSDGTCTGTGSVTITEPSAVTVNVSSTNAGCTSGGSATATASGGTGAYTYAWSNGASTATINDVAAGTYTVTVTDANGCTATGSATVSSNTTTVDVTVTGTNVICNGGTDGSATAQVNGSGNYTYAWSNGATTATISGLGAGTYTVTVSDGTCTGTGSVTITEPSAIVVTGTVTGDGGCAASTATSTASATGGTAPYTFTYSNGASGVSVTLAPGTYTLTATDANGCTGTTTVTVQGGGGITATVTTTDTNCPESNVGTASAQGFGGTAPYTYLWNNGATTQMLTGLSAGVYRVTVTDSNGCEASAVGAVNNTVFINVSVVATTNVACADDATGSATVSATGGTGPYTYSWSNGQTTATATNLAVGTYTVTATDANGCNNSTSVTITSDSDLTVEVLVWNPECGDESNGKVMAMVEGGTEPYTYVWSTGAVTQAILNLSAGTYSVTVTDAAGCTATASADLESAMPPLVDIQVIQTVDAAGGGTLQATASGGLAPYAYDWSNGANTPTITGLSAGTYTVTVTDHNFCQGVGQVVLAGPGDITGNVFNDINSNGIREAGELGVGNITVRLRGENIAGFNVDRTVTTNSAGNYVLEGVNNGTYRVQFSNLPHNYVFSPADRVANESLDSDVTDPNTGFTDEFTFNSSSFVEYLNAGIYRLEGLNVDVDINVNVVRGGKVEVTWELPAIVSNFAFVVERSVDGGETFEMVGDDAIIIEEDGMYQYRFVDDSPKRGRSYYRVGYVMDTELEYSNAAEAMLSMPEFAMVYPNPVSDRVMVELFSALSSDVHLDLMDTNGRIIQSKKMISGDMHEPMTLAGLNPGIYFIRILRTDDGEPTLIRVVKK